jgi:hypothetical protein
MENLMPLSSLFLGIFILCGVPPALLALAGVAVRAALICSIFREGENLPATQALLLPIGCVGVHLLLLGPAPRYVASLALADQNEGRLLRVRGSRVEGLASV